MMSVTKEQYLEALRSEQFKQGKNYLRDKDDNYCCLGVLCELEGVPNRLDEHGYYEYDGTRQRLPERILDIESTGVFGISKFDIAATEYWCALNKKYRIVHDSLSSANDAGATFEEIATLIEHCWRCNAFK